MTLIIIPAEDVREGEPRWWYATHERAREVLRSIAERGDTQLPASGIDSVSSDKAWRFAIVDRCKRCHGDGLWPCQCLTVEDMPPAAVSASPPLDLGPVKEALAFHHEPYRWILEHMDEQHWPAVEAVMSLATDLVTEIEALRRWKAEAMAVGVLNDAQADALDKAMGDDARLGTIRIGEAARILAARAAQIATQRDSIAELMQQIDAAKADRDTLRAALVGIGDVLDNLGPVGDTVTSIDWHRYADQLAGLARKMAARPVATAEVSAIDREAHRLYLTSASSTVTPWAALGPVERAPWIAAARKAIDTPDPVTPVLTAEMLAEAMEKAGHHQPDGIRFAMARGILAALGPVTLPVPAASCPGCSSTPTPPGMRCGYCATPGPAKPAPAAQVSAEPVAWRFRPRSDGLPWDWRYEERREGDIAAKASGAHEVEPLYTHPPAPVREVPAKVSAPRSESRLKVGDRARAVIEGRVCDVSDSHGLCYQIRVVYETGSHALVWVDADDAEPVPLGGV